MTDFGGAAGKNVLEESRDEFDAGQSDAANFLRAVIAVAESDHAVVDGFKPAVGDGDPEDVASEIVGAPRIPGQVIHRFQSKASTDSNRSHPVIPSRKHPAIPSGKPSSFLAMSESVDELGGIVCEEDDSDAGQSAGTFSLFSNEEEANTCRQKDCPCGKSKKFYDSSSGWGLPTGRLHAVAAINHSTVADYVTARQSGRTGSLGRCPRSGRDGFGKDDCFQRQRRNGRRPRQRSAPNWPAIHEDLRSHKHLTLQLVWQEYKQSNSGRLSVQPVLLAVSTMGSASSIWCCDRNTAPAKSCSSITPETRFRSSTPRPARSTKASIFVAVLGASNYTLPKRRGIRIWGRWIRAHVRALEFLGGAPALLVPDNCKTAVRRPCRYEPDLNPTYQEMAAHYGMAIIPARVRKPRDKAKVEAGVLLVERWILAALRKRRFFSLAESQSGDRRTSGSAQPPPFPQTGRQPRRTLCHDRSAGALRPLPAEAYTFAEWKKARVHIDYHIEIDRHYYSVPYTLLHRELDVRYTAMTVEIFHRGQRIASHARSSKIGGHTTDRCASAQVPSTLSGMDTRTSGATGHPPLALLPQLSSIRSFNPVLIPNRDSAVVWAFCVWEKPTARIVWKPQPLGPAISTRVPIKV